jgi:hypothetical protein
MPPKSRARRDGGHGITVGATHPASIATATRRAAGGSNISALAVAGGSNRSATSTRKSPLPSAKTTALLQIHTQASAHMHAPIAGVAPESAETMPGVTVLVGSGVACQYAGAHDSMGGEPLPVEAGEGLGLGDGLGLAPSFPPLWNTWWCGGCRALHFVRDGSKLGGACTCVATPAQSATM